MKRLGPVLMAAFVLTACGQQSEESGAGTSTSGASTTVSGGTGAGKVCSATEFDVTYPDSWWVHDRDPEHSIPACALFHPEPLEIEYNSEAPGLAIDLGVDGLWTNMRLPAPDAEVVSERQATVGGREAVRYEYRADEGTILPAGTLSTVWVVNLDPLGLVATTSQVGDLDYAANQKVLDEMVESVRLAGAPRCSAEGADPEVGPQEIPEAVAAKRTAVAAAAAACDYAELDRLAAPGFKSGFGEEPGSPSVFWRQAEASGEEPMRFLVGMLQRPVALLPNAAPPSYVWPSAFTYEWDKVPDADREALRPLYGDEDFKGFADFGAYIGWRTTIDESGSWDYYVAGD
ncbi:MAG: hypothetical protein ACRDZ3_13560 [Acidimicrobiia bacterium]